jgi:hypothetical protein
LVVGEIDQVRRGGAVEKNVKMQCPQCRSIFWVLKTDVFADRAAPALAVLQRELAFA